MQGLHEFNRGVNEFNRGVNEFNRGVNRSVTRQGCNLLRAAVTSAVTSQGCCCGNLQIHPLDLGHNFHQVTKYKSAALIKRHTKFTCDNQVILAQVIMKHYEYKFTFDTPCDTCSSEFKMLQIYSVLGI